MSLAHFFKKIKCATNERQGHLSRTASAHPETDGPGQFGERCQPSLELDDEELLLELPLLRLGTVGAAAIEVGGDIVRSAGGAPGKLPKAPTKTAMKRRNPTLQRDSQNFFFNFLNFEGWGWSIICHL